MKTCKNLFGLDLGMIEPLHRKLKINKGTYLIHAVQSHKLYTEKANDDHRL